MSELELLSTVALLEDVPDKGLRRGQVGTIVEVLSMGIYGVEFGMTRVAPMRLFESRPTVC
jgi:hypothetical protein